FAAVALACLAGLAGDAHADSQVASGGSGTGSIGAAGATGAVHARRTAPPRWPLLSGLAVLGAALVAVAIVELAGIDIGATARLGLVAGVVALGVALVLAGVLPRRLRAPLGADVRWQRRHLAAAAIASASVALVALGVVLAAVFDLRDPVPGERALLGYSLIPTETYETTLGGTWRMRDDLDATFDVFFEQIAFGLFPWAALA